MFALIVILTSTNTSETNLVSTNENPIIKNPVTREAQGLPIAIVGYVFLPNGENANLETNITGYDFDSDTSADAELKLKNGLTHYQLVFSFWTYNDHIRIIASDFSPIDCSYHNTTEFYLPVVAVNELEVNITLFEDEKPTISTGDPLSYNPTKLYENDEAHFRVRLFDDNGVTSTKISINNTIFNMQMIVGPVTGGVWGFDYQFTVKGTYSVYIIAKDGVENQVISPKLTIKINTYTPSLLVFAANETRIQLNEAVMFNVTVPSDRVISNLTLRIIHSELLDLPIISSPVNNTYTKIVLFNVSNVYYCSVFGYESSRFIESHQIAISCNTTAFPPVMIGLEVNATQIELSEQVLFSIQFIDETNISTVLLISGTTNYTMFLSSGNFSQGIWQYIWNTTQPGLYYFKIFAIDVDGIRSGNTSVILITVLPPEHPAIILTISPAALHITLKLNSLVEFTVLAEDDRGIVTIYLYIEGLPLLLSLSQGTSINGTWLVKRKMDLPGYFNMHYEITDSNGHLTVSDPQTVIVDDVPFIFTLQTNATLIRQYQSIYFQVMAEDDYNVSQVRLFVNTRQYDLIKLEGNITHSKWGNMIRILDSGSVSAIAVAIDNYSQYTLSQELHLNVLVNYHPDIAVLRASKIRITQNETVTLLIAATDDVKVASATLYIDENSFAMVKVSGNDTHSVWGYNVTFTEIKEYSVTAKVFDDSQQASDISNTVIVFVTKAGSSSSNTLFSSTSNQPISGYDCITLLAALIIGFYYVKHKKSQG